MPNIYSRRACLSAVLGGVVAGVQAAQPGWINLLPTRMLKGQTFKGWRAEGHAIWSIDDGVLVGRPAPGALGGDLFTEKRWTVSSWKPNGKYAGPHSDSGIWFRVNGENTGYQADILEDAVVRSGSLYCMGKEFIGVNRDQATVNRDDWNRMRIPARGRRFSHRAEWETGGQGERLHTFPGALPGYWHPGA